MKEIYVGAAYYPEMWDESEVDKDIQRCKKAGINTLRVGEFAWGKMEPSEGKFNFGWLTDVVDKLYKNGIYTVMCTPTCTPPRWMLDKYEDMRITYFEGHRADVSSRCHICKTSKIAREKNRIIVREMAKAFKGHKGIIGWQIDNEIYPYGDGCYCPSCQNAFRAYLKDKFGTVENLNKEWGMVRWSLEYESFDAVKPPHTSQWRHPSLRKAWWDFQCAQIKSFVEEQADEIRMYSSEPIGTDMMTNNFLGYYDVCEKLDVMQINHYNNYSDLPRTTFWYDFLRPVKDRPFWVTETQVGWNGSEYAESGYRPEGNCYVNTWLPVAHGGEMNLYWLFRTHPNGHEIGHGAVYSASGRMHRVSEEIGRAVKDFEKCGEVLEGKLHSDIAVHFSSTASNIFGSASILKNLNYGEHSGSVIIDKFYKAFSHYNVDVIDTPHTLDGYKVIFSPFLACVDENGLKERITDWVKAGGKWIVGPMSDIMNTEVTKYTDAPYSFLEELAGVYTKYQKPIDNGVFKAKWADGRNCEISSTFDAYETVDCESLAKYSDCEFEGLSAVVRRKVGKGEVILLGTVLCREDLRKLSGLEPILKASANVVLTERTGKKDAIIAIECEYKEGFVELDGEYTDLLSGNKLSGKVKIKPYGVLVLVK